MAEKAYIDHIEVLEASERHGALRRLVRACYVNGIDTTTWELLTQGLDNAEVPQYGSYLTDAAVNASDLMLVERNPRIQDKNSVMVELVYENFMDLPENLDNPRGGYIGGEVRCNLQQKTSNLDINGDQITVSHHYPEDDPQYPDETKTQGGEIQYFEPQRAIHIRGIKQTQTPWLLANAIIGRVNNATWSGEAARTWLCTGVRWKLAWLGPGATGLHRYFLDFEFQYDADTWDPTVVFIDDRTGKPPPDLVEGTGYKTITKMPSCNFDSVIGAQLQGA